MRGRFVVFVLVCVLLYCFVVVVGVYWFVVWLVFGGCVVVFCCRIVVLVMCVFVSVVVGYWVFCLGVV